MPRIVSTDLTRVNRVAYVANVSAAFNNSAVTFKTIKEIRRANLDRLVETFPSAEAFARAIETHRVYLSDLLRGMRGMGDELARRIEAKCDKPHGWMDQNHEPAPPKVSEPPALYDERLTEEELEVVRALRKARGFHAERLEPTRATTARHGKKRKRGAA